MANQTYETIGEEVKARDLKPGDFLGGGWIYLGPSPTTGTLLALSPDYSFQGSIREPSARVNQRDDWFGAADNVFGVPLSRQSTEGDITNNPQNSDGGARLPTLAEFEMILDQFTGLFREGPHTTSTEGRRGSASRVVVDPVLNTVDHDYNPSGGTYHRAVRSDPFDIGR